MLNSVRAALTMVLLLASVLAVLLILYAYRRRKVPGARSFMYLMFISMLYCLGYLGEINSNALQEALFWFHIQHIPIPVQHYMWFLLGLEYARVPSKILARLRYAALIHPVLYLCIYYIPSLRRYYASDFFFAFNGHFNVIDFTRGPLYILVVVSGTALSLICVGLYLHGYFKTSMLQRDGYLLMLLASLFPWSAVYLNATGVSLLGIDYFPVFSVVSGLIYTLGIFRHRIFSTYPIATQTVFRQSKEAIMILDWEERIVDVNILFLSLYPELRRLGKKDTFAVFLATHSEFAGYTDEVQPYSYRMMIGVEQRYFSAQITRLLSDDGSLEIGRIFTISDITLFIEHQQRLEQIAFHALSRAEASEISFLQAQIKPHFLNNTLSIISSMITREPQEAKRLITELGEYLARCYFFDSSSPMTELTQELESVSTYIEIEKARFRERLTFRLDCDKIPNIQVPRLVLQPLVENAIRHGVLKKAEGGTVVLTIREKTDGVHFEVSDDGGGIAADKLEALLDECSPHTNGIGISNINKRLKRYYNTRLDIQSGQAEGTRAAFFIPVIKHNSSESGGTHGQD